MFQEIKRGRGGGEDDEEGEGKEVDDEEDEEEEDLWLMWLLLVKWVDGVCMLLFRLSTDDFRLLLLVIE